MPKHLGQRLVFFDVSAADYVAEKFGFCSVMVPVSAWGLLASSPSSLCFPASYGGDDGLHVRLSWGARGAWMFRALCSLLAVPGPESRTCWEG